MTVPMETIEEHFAAEGRTPKGRKARRAIFAATRDLIVARGVESTSLEAIANAAGLSQAALRHHFPSPGRVAHRILLRRSPMVPWPADRPADRWDRRRQGPAQRCIAWHLEYMEHVDTTFWLGGIGILDPASAAALDPRRFLTAGCLTTTPGHL